jgi:hypothetical protein
MYCFLWGTNWIYVRVCYVEESRPPLCSSGQSTWIQNGDVLFPVRYELNYICYVEESRPPLWSIQRSRFDSRHYQIFWVVGLERGPLSLVSTIEELLGRNSSGSGLENREYGRREPSRWLCSSFYPQKLAFTSPTSGGLSVGIVRSRTQTTEFFIHHRQNPLVSKYNDPCWGLIMIT